MAKIKFDHTQKTLFDAMGVSPEEAKVMHKKTSKFLERITVEMVEKKGEFMHSELAEKMIKQLPKEVIYSLAVQHIKKAIMPVVAQLLREQAKDGAKEPDSFLEFLSKLKSDVSGKE